MLDFFYFLLVLFLLAAVAIHLVNESRTGRAWRALREDPLAAEAMTMPVNRLKLLAFAFGAATAGLTGAVFASLQGSVFPQNFDVQLLIIIYAMVILGGAGSLPGVALGAIVVNGLLEVLTRPEQARVVFYASIVIGLLLLVRPWRWFAYVAAGTLVFGLVMRQLGEAFWDRGVAGSVSGRPRRRARALAAAAERRAAVRQVRLRRPDRSDPGADAREHADPLARPAGGAVAGVVRLGERADHRAAPRPASSCSARILVALMAARPQGLFGSARVEIV